MSNPKPEPYTRRQWEATKNPGRTWSEEALAEHRARADATVDHLFLRGPAEPVMKLLSEVTAACKDTGIDQSSWMDLPGHIRRLGELAGAAKLPEEG